MSKTSSKLKKALLATVTVVLAAGAVQTSATAATSAEPATTESSRSAAPKVIKRNITITKDGTVLDGALVKGAIAVKADNVTIKNTTVRYKGRHKSSIRIYPGADGTRILRTKVVCKAPRKNGVVFGNYVAKRVRIENCRRGFVSSRRNPARVTKSWVDGKPVTIRGEVPDGPTPPAPTPPPAPNPGGRPDASNTGVPAGTQLRSAAGMTITQDGAVIDGLHIRGTVTIEADNVTIRNSLVQAYTDGYPIHVEDGATGALIENVEVDNMGATGIGVLFSGGSSGTVRRANIHSGEDGIRIQSDDVTIEYSFVHTLVRYPGGHHDTVQIRRGDNVTLRGNTLLPYKASTQDEMNAAIQIGSLLGDDQISNLRVIGNYMNGGGYTVNGGGRNEVDSALYSGNRFGRNFKYGVSGNLDNSVWDSTNVYDDNGAPAR